VAGGGRSCRIFDSSESTFWLYGGVEIWVERVLSMSAATSGFEDGFVKDCDADDSKLMRGSLALPYMYTSIGQRNSSIDACMRI
jgi:hypothetical protein